MNSPAFVGGARPVCFGTGLVALDVVVHGERRSDPCCWGGGSCGNVLTVLSYLNWLSFPVARLGSDAAAVTIQADLATFGVRLDHVVSDPRVQTPIIVERIHTNRKGLPSHRFELRCPECGAWLPRYRPVLKTPATEVAQSLSHISAFYFDRVSAGAMALASRARSLGALVVFEPSSLGKQKDFEAAVALSDIVKYSHERMGDLGDLAAEFQSVLVVETLGADGLRFRFRNRASMSPTWQYLPAFPVHQLRDSAGAGDWCTAAIIAKLGRWGRNGILRATNREIRDALNFGQALASLNCRFEGARGAMYSLHKSEMPTLVKAILAGKPMSESMLPPPDVRRPCPTARICGSCRLDECAPLLSRTSAAK